tara:strand:+ start:17764 stop:19521 length:1758 start_codon:yes stop_codon:yes gene_type:complete
MSKLRQPENFSDYVALSITKILRFFADTFFSKRYGHRAVVLETVAGVPGMVAGMWIHLKCLRKMTHDRGWIKTLLDEAENERMHLMTFIEIAQPNWFERALILLAQGLFWHFYFILYIFFPRTAHRLVGYFEEEAVISYTSYLEQVENNPSLNVKAPQIAIDYWRLKSDAKLIDVIKAVRNDEAGHAKVNHGLADTIDEEKSKISNMKQIEFKKKEPKFNASQQDNHQSNLTSNLFRSTKIGDISLLNRIVMAPLTRSRASSNGVPTPMMIEYYAQRASAGLIIAEATQISQQAQGYCLTPGIYTEEQTDKWMDIVSNVHNKGGKICLQLCHAGRISHEELQPDKQPPVAPSAIKANASTWLKSGSTEVSPPRELQSFEIANIIEDFRQAAFNAKKAGFDMVEIHAANGYLIDQFLRDSSNKRTDNYGGSIENRVRFLLEIVDAISSIFPANKIGCRISPTSTFNDIYDSDPQNLFEFLAIELGKKGLVYLHAIEGQSDDEKFNFDRIYDLFKNNGGLSCMVNRHEDKIAESPSVDLMVFGIPFIANPDFVFRLEHNLPLNEADPSTFYGGNERGYTDYPFYQQS